MYRSKKGGTSDLAVDADVVGFVCPVYEWDVPEPTKEFTEQLTVNEKAYTFMVATYIAVHSRCFETIDGIGCCGKWNPYPHHHK